VVIHPCLNFSERALAESALVATETDHYVSFQLLHFYQKVYHGNFYFISFMRRHARKNPVLAFFFRNLTEFAPPCSLASYAYDDN